MTRNWVFLRSTCANYGEFLELAIRESRADQHAARQFKHAAAGIYVEEQDLVSFYNWISRYEAGLDATAPNA